MNFTLNKNNLDGLVGKLKELDQDKLWSVTVKPYKSIQVHLTKMNTIGNLVPS